MNFTKWPYKNHAHLGKTDGVEYVLKATVLNYWMCVCFNVQLV